MTTRVEILAFLDQPQQLIHAIPQVQVSYLRLVYASIFLDNGRLPPPLMSTNPLPALGFSMRASSSLMGRASTPSSRQNNSAMPLGLSNIPQTFQSNTTFPLIF